jgi:undecaprenyl diphosphate synthase
VAIIMDGSGRWAEARGLPRGEGHRAGRAAVRRIVEAAPQCGIRTLTLFTFSTDNWGRSEAEVGELMRIFESFFRLDAQAFVRDGFRMSVLGRRGRLPDSLRDAIESVEAASAGGKHLHVRLAIDYSGRDAIVAAARQFRQVPEGTEYSSLLVPNTDEPLDVDLLIRTGGELRLSNCPLWEIAYAELYFTERLWPDFGAEDLHAAVQEFHTRDRRFGRIPTGVRAMACSGPKS